LDLTFNVSRVDEGDASVCGPLAGAVVDVWHCDAAGEYSGVEDNAAGDLMSALFAGQPPLLTPLTPLGLEPGLLLGAR